MEIFGCDEGWNAVTDTWHETLEDAKAQAEFEYEGVNCDVAGAGWIMPLSIHAPPNNSMHPTPRHELSHAR